MPGAGGKNHEQCFGRGAEGQRTISVRSAPPEMPRAAPAFLATERGVEEREHAGEVLELVLAARDAVALVGANHVVDAHAALAQRSDHAVGVRPGEA